MNQLEIQNDFAKWRKAPFDANSGFLFLDQRNDQQIKETKVVVGFSGGIDSLVASYLLKKRGLQCLAVGIVFVNKEEIKEKLDNYHKKLAEKAKSHLSLSAAKKSSSSNKIDDLLFLKDSCSADNLPQLREICDQLGISFYGVNAVDEFDDEIFDRLVSKRIGGETFNPCVFCNNLKIEILLRKAHALKADFISTGHYAKIIRIGHSDKMVPRFNILKGHDFENDQSFLLGRLNQEHLSRTIFPLAELRRVEVEKVAQRISTSIKIGVRRNWKNICFLSNGSIKEFLEIKSPERLRLKGPIIVKKTQMTVGDHSGIHQYEVGDNNLQATTNRSTLMNIDSTLTVLALQTPNKILVGLKDEAMSMGCSVKKLHLSPDIELTKSLEVFIQLDFKHHEQMKGGLILGRLILKNNGMGLLEFSTPLYYLCRGDFLVFYSSREISAKILGSGFVDYLGEMHFLNKTHKLDPIKIDDMGRPIGAKVNPFKF